ncbi:helix-turn-helix DNA binding domain protein [Mycobacterium phage Flathead]|uniref:HTH DNA-binding domain protein n=3 Tax=Cheoctovirus TaxID=1623281 RepID=A0A2K9VE16_9CAUD|nr:HTH DNA binding protein [Mycobacterium phage Bobi]YP_009956694.1 HTH DNA binding protein [Mycobacterium phage Empress]YP_009957641.1 HTH DNA binding protein [Mycobacterium phage Girr]YP_009960711.1 HTH DNA binding protein [Mycobacterium phage OldBen]AXQ65040.1 helix-turn-helix DNA binding domain protein [Mycobacterium phage Ruby]QAY06066.1 helix-turn-helix DNA binding domain protein [Mycobacterium phage MisterCuddles]QGH79161.1 helix-turn-helix DNA binding domain protein [Mycobacterium pha
MTLADRLAQNRVKRQKVAAEMSELTSEMFDLVKAAYADGMPAPEIARQAGITRGRVYQIIRGE